MSPKRKHRTPDPHTPISKPSKSTTDPTTEITYFGRDGLGAYIASPTSFPPSRVVSHSENYVVINDLYPKSSVHILLLPRSPCKTFLHPFDALSDPLFLASVQTEVRHLRTLVAKELRRRYGKFSSLDKEREEAMDADPPPETLPPGRDWEKEVIAGVHAVPSMNHLHIHILSKDRMSECMRHRKHYNSFNTGFMVPVDDFPLAEDDARRHPGREGFLHSEMRCWRCGRNFKNRFKSLKEHLEEEFEVWKRE